MNLKSLILMINSMLIELEGSKSIRLQENDRVDIISKLLEKYHKKILDLNIEKRQILQADKRKRDIERERQRKQREREQKHREQELRHKMAK